jgi:DNA-binding transcriptional MerR regulator
MDKKEYFISELAEKANVTVRTIRYYMDEGLLPVPTTRSKYALFTQEHLDRLELIRRLKEIHLPLEEIKRLLQETSDQEIVRLLTLQDEQGKISPPSSVSIKEQAPGKAALDYLSNITSTRSAFQRKDYPSTLQNSASAPMPPAMQQAPTPETWERIMLAPGVELNIRRTTDRALSAKIKELVRISKELFKNI